MIEAGSYLARGVSMVLGKSSKKGTPCVTVTFRIEDEKSPQNGQLIDWIGYMTEATRARTAEAVALCGFDGTDPATITKNITSIVVEHEPYTTDKGEARTSAKVAWVNDPARGGAKSVALDVAEQERVKQELRGLVLAHKQAKPSNGTGTEFPHGHNAPSATPAATATPPKF